MDRLSDVLLLFFIEIVEANQQKGNTFSQLVNYLHGLFRSRPFRFLLLHTSMLYVAYLVFVQGIANGWTGTLLFIKGVDLLLKLNLFWKIGKSGEPFSTERLYGAPDVGITPWMRYAGAVFYTFLLAMGISDSGGENGF